MIPIAKLKIDLTPDQTKQMAGVTKILMRMAEKNKPGAFLAQINCTGNDFNARNRSFGITPHLNCYVIPNYLMKRLIRIINRASNPANKIPRRNYWKAAATGIMKYIKNTKIERRPVAHINEENSRKAYGGKFEDPYPIEDDIPF